MSIAKLSFIIVFLSLIFCCGSCNTETPKYKFSRSDKTLIDSLYKKLLPELKVELDSMCNEYRDKKYQVIKDSITEIRLAEIEQFLPE